MEGFLLVAIESRKGGAGKTTAALSISQVLLHRGYSVLVLDADITGTDTTDVLDSPFWSESTSIVQRSRLDSCWQRANLVEIFYRDYLSGRPAPLLHDRPQRRAMEGLTCRLDRVNVLGSDLYDSQRGEYLEDPSILFDQLHAFWFVSLLRDLATDFAKVSLNGGRPPAIVVDNSPGYTGVGPAIREWVTDLGPDQGKTLIVATLDTQDLISCGHAADSLQHLQQSKLEAALAYRRLLETSESPEAADIRFILRLAETSAADSVASSAARFGDLSFYHQAPPSRLEQTSSDMYQAVIINRVPPLVGQRALRLDFDGLAERLGPENETLLRLLRDERYARSRRMIPFDPNLEYQFSGSILRTEARGGSRRQKALQQRLEELDQQLRSAVSRHGHRDTWSTPSIGEFASLDRIVRSALNQATRLGFRSVASILKSDWLPWAPIESLAHQFAIFQAALSHGEEDPMLLGPEEVEQSERGEALQVLLHEALASHKSDMPGDIAEPLVGSLAAALAAAVTSLVRLEGASDRHVVELAKRFLKIEMIEWKRYKQRGRRGSVPRFLAHQSIILSPPRQGSASDEIQALLPRSWVRNAAQRWDLGQLYGRCTSAQARILDVSADAQFYLRALMVLTSDELDIGTLTARTASVFDAVIVSKTMGHRSGLGRLATGVATEEMLRGFWRVLNDVLEEWGIVDQAS